MKTETEGIVRISNLLNLTRQEFTILEKQVFILALLNLKNYQGFNLKLDNDETIKIEFSANELKETNRERIKDALDKITSRKVHFDIFTKEKDHVGYLVPFSYASYTAVNGAYSKICIDINSRVKKAFFELANGFTSIDLKAILSLKSVYSIRMYELMSQYTNQGNWTVKLDDLRNAVGLQLLEYKNYGMFEKRILIYSQKELWEHCGIYFEWEIAQKERKKITALTFTIRTKEKQEKVQVNANIKTTMEYIATLTPKDIAEKSHILMTHYTLSAEQKDYILSDTSIFNDFIRVHAIIENMIERNNPPKDRTKYLAKSLGLDKVRLSKV
jgi:plasmid replication initiation protein